MWANENEGTGLEVDSIYDSRCVELEDDVNGSRTAVDEIEVVQTAAR